MTWRTLSGETHPHPCPPLEGEGFHQPAKSAGELLFPAVRLNKHSPFKGRVWVGMGFDLNSSVTAVRNVSVVFPLSNVCNSRNAY